MTMQDVEVWVMVNADGSYVAHEDEGSLAEAYGGRVGDLADAGGIRRLKITVKVPLPEPFELIGEVVANEQPSALKVA